MNSALIAKMPARTSTAAMIMRSRRSTITSSLTAAQGRHGRRHRLQCRGLRRAVGWRGAAGGIPGGRRTRRTAGTAEGGQRQIGKHAAAALGGFVDNDFVAVLQDLFHGLEVEPLESDVLRRLKDVIDRGETVGVALGAGDDLLTIGFRLLLDRGGGTSRLRDNVVAI